MSGTPIGARNLQDIQALLQILQHTPFSSDTAWSRIISGPLARGGDGEQTYHPFYKLLMLK